MLEKKQNEEILIAMPGEAAMFDEHHQRSMILAFKSSPRCQTKHGMQLN
jgi:hypothetical protein